MHNYSDMNLKWLASFCLTLVVWLQCLLGGELLAAPQLDLRQQDRASLRMDVRASWQTAMVPDKGTAPSQPLDAQAAWLRPDSQFEPSRAVPVTVKKGERLVGRLSVLVGPSPHSLLVEVPMPRLDVVHLSYRYNDETWTQLTAGDQVPMVKWPFANYVPAFVIPPKVGLLHVVLEIPVPGLFPSPVVLWGDPAYREQRAIANLEVGAALSMALISLLLCIGAAVIFKRFAFAAVGIYSVSIFLVTAGQGGFFGVYIGTNTTWFNDYVKYISAAVFGAIVPWTISFVVTQKHYSKLVAHAASFWLVGSLLAAVVMLLTLERATQWALLSPFLIASLVFGLGIALGSVVRGQPHGVLSLAAVLMLCLGIFAPIASYWGYLDGTFSFSITVVAFLISNTLLLLALLLQYRHGNRVIARAEYSPGRDALTGLLNRDVFERKLANTLREAKSRNLHVLFFYIAVSGRDSLEERYGGEGFESGMVQIAAALSSSISVVDTIARISTNAFGVLVVMPHDAKLGNALAQKVISRIMAVASHSAPMAQTARIAAAWLPAYAAALPDLELASRQVLQKLDDGKRIGWLGGAAAHSRTASTPGSTKPDKSHGRSRSRADELSSLINGIEDTMHREDAAPGNEKPRRLAKAAGPHGKFGS